MERLKELRALPLERKIQISQTRIIEWYNHYHGNVVVSFSGGKDSTVLLHLVRKIYPNIKAVFSNTGLEYPEIQKHIKSLDNVDIITPSMRFDEVVSTYGYPLISKEVAEAIYYARRIRSRTKPMKQAEWKRMELKGNRRMGLSRQAQQETDAQFLAGEYTGTEQFGQKSRFNKEKWLPMAYTPFMISHYCCNKMKKSPIKKYNHEYHFYPIVGTLTEES